MAKLPTTNTYTELVQDLKKEIAEGLARAQQAYDREKVITYWKMGESITKHLLSNVRADYGKELYKNLSRDLDISGRLLYQMTQFYSVYLAFSPIQNLKWSHYRLLSSVQDDKKRAVFEKQISKDNWSMRTLEKAVRRNKRQVTRKKLSVFRERLYTYRIFKDKCSENMLIDLGFKVYKETELLDFDGEFVETFKTAEEKYEYKEADAKRKHLYVYKAFVTEVIDGDTLWVMIDCGFKTWIKQKIRLHKIDTSALETPEGIRAKDYVSNVLKNTSFVIIKCHGRDKFDRYLVDLLYLKDEEDPQVVLREGSFLNQELLDENLAVPMN